METDSSRDKPCFVAVAGMKRVYEPRLELRAGGKKHPCPDCHFCQFCSDARCQSCRHPNNRVDKGSCQNLSLAEQILLYERINAQSHSEPSESSHDEKQQ